MKNEFISFVFVIIVCITLVISTFCFLNLILLELKCPVGKLNRNIILWDRLLVFIIVFCFTIDFDNLIKIINKAIKLFVYLSYVYWLVKYSRKISMRGIFRLCFSFIVKSIYKRLFNNETSFGDPMLLLYWQICQYIQSFKTGRE